MAIRFRCAYCNQLMGIGTRKAGSVVHCPKCNNALVVPEAQNGTGNSPERSRSAANPQAGAGGVFEQNDFEKLFDAEPATNPQVLQPMPLARDPVPFLGPESFIDHDAAPAPSISRPPHGIFIPTGFLAAGAALLVALLGLVFFLGVLVGRS